MIRVIYTWHVPDNCLDEFTEIWREATNQIRENIEGARGSLMLQNHSHPKKVLTIARWNALEEWMKFWKDGRSTAMRRMHELATRVAVDVFEEVEDRTQ